MLSMEMVPGDIHHLPSRVGTDLEDLIYAVFGSEPARETDRPKRPVVPALGTGDLFFWIWSSISHVTPCSR